MHPFFCLLNGTTYFYMSNNRFRFAYRVWITVRSKHPKQNRANQDAYKKIREVMIDVVLNGLGLVVVVKGNDRPVASLKMPLVTIKKFFCERK